MTDRELLELAAKAAGLCIESWSLNLERAWVYPEGTVPNKDREYSGCKLWNPLTDDGDALRLAVTCKLKLSITGDSVFVCRWTQAFEDALYEPMREKPDAVRRCIVRAAAEIGKSI